MYILKALTAACERFIEQNVSSNMRSGNSIIIEFNLIREPTEAPNTVARQKPMITSFIWP